MSDGATVRVLLADDHTAVRAGLRAVLGTAGTDGGTAVEVVGEAADGATALAQARVLRPDVVVMDLRMPGTDGVAATATVVAEGLAEVLVLTTFDDDELVLAALRAGAAGFLLKTADAPTLLDAVRRVAAGEGVVAPEVTRTLLAALDRAPAAAPAGPDLSALVGRLTDREVDVLRHLGHGRSNADLATALGISPLTAKTHVSRLLGKLGLTSRTQAALLARDAGLTGPPPPGTLGA
ncbi:response regulator transcription factor [Kineococcus endophyticus]|uniref:Response regulator transcription factor n=1 Tax=Kineococcus endophyticus TaxID=1181883 RepID=A0ABV3P9A9_9ACTN